MRPFLPVALMIIIVTGCGDNNDQTSEVGVAQASPGDTDIQYFDSNRVEIAFIDVGKGQPVVFLHGFAMNLDMIRGISSDFVQAGYRFVAIDARGHGRSGKPHDAKAYGAEMADDVVRLLDHLKLRQAHVIGYSMGGAIANKLRERHPGRILSVTLGGVGKDVTAWYKDGFRLTEAAKSLRSGQGVKYILQESGVVPATLTEAEIEKMNARTMANQDSLALAAVLDALPELNVSEESLKENTVPTLILVGANAHERPSAEELAKIMNKATLIIIEDADHIGAPEQPQFLQEIIRFIGLTR